MSRHEPKERTQGLKAGLIAAIVIAVLLAVMLAVAPQRDALQPIPLAQATQKGADASGAGNGPTGYFPDRFRGATGEDLPQVEAF
jgi:hypothetical protein